MPTDQELYNLFTQWGQIPHSFNAFRLLVLAIIRAEREREDAIREKIESEINDSFRKNL